VGGGESRSRYENPLDRKVREGSSPSARTKHQTVQTAQPSFLGGIVAKSGSYLDRAQ